MAEKTTAFTGPVVVGLNDKKGEIRLTDGKNVNEAKYLSIAAPDTITSDTTLTFPNGAGTAGQILSTDGSGNLSWVDDQTAGNPAGTNGQVQTNDGGTFGAISEGTAGQVLKSNGAGVAPSFQTDATNSPGGSNTEMQFNDNGTFGAVSNGTAGQILTSNGAGSTPTFQAAPAGGIAAVVDDTTPQLGGSLDLNNQGINGQGTINVSGGSLLLKSDAPSGTNNGPIIGSNTANGVLGFGNMALGTNAGRDFASCAGNIAVGTATLLRTTTGGSNVGVGREVLRQNTTSSSNTGIGYNALDNTTGGSNTAVGSGAGSQLTSGQNNTLLGAQAQASSATVSNEVTIGNSNITSLRIPGLQSGASSGDVLTYDGTDITLSAPTGADPITSSLNIGNTKTITLNAYFPVGGKNIVWGENAGSSLTGTPDGNILIGDNAGNSMTGPNGNVIIGKNAMSSNVSNGQNVVIGNAAAADAFTGQNTVIGDGAGGVFTTGGDNTFVGRAAAFFGNPNRTVAIGSTAMLTGGGSNCVAVGYAAGSGVSGANNTAIGHEAGNAMGSSTNCTVLGNASNSSSASATNEITLGNSSISTLRCNVTSITALSDARDKKDVEDANIGLDFINDLRPVKFEWNTRDGAKKDIKEVGFIAQELDEVQQKHGVEDYLQLVLKNNPDKLEAAPGKLIPILVQAIKDLKKEIDELKKA